MGGEQQAVPVKLFLDEALEKITLEVEGHRRSMIDLSLGDIRDIYSYGHLLDHDLSMYMKAVAQSYEHLEDRDSAAFFQYRTTGCPEGWLCLILADEVEQG